MIFCCCVLTLSLLTTQILFRNHNVFRYLLKYFDSFKETIQHNKLRVMMNIIIEELLKIIAFFYYITAIGIWVLIAKNNLLFIRHIKMVEKTNEGTKEYFDKLKWQIYGLIFAVVFATAFLGIPPTVEKSSYELFYIYSRYIIYYAILLGLIEIAARILKYCKISPFHTIPSEKKL